MRSTLPTSHGFKPLSSEAINNPLPPSSATDFEVAFQMIGTLDNSNYCCASAAIDWRSKLTFNGTSGEEAIMAYSQTLAQDAGRLTSQKLGTEVLENEQGTLGQCSFSNVRLPLDYAKVAGGDQAQAVKVAQWLAATLVKEYDTFIAVIIHGGAWWVRLSAQVYLTLQDFEWGATVLKELCQRVEKGEWMV